MKPLSIILIILSIIFALINTGHIETFFDAPSLLVVIFPVIASIASRHGFVGFGHLFKGGEGGNETKERKEILHTMGVTGVISGVLGTHIGVVIMLGNLADPKAIGPAMAVAILPTFYGLFIFLLTTILSHLNLGTEL